MSSQHNLRRNPARESQRAAAIAAKSSTQARPSPQGKIPSSKLLSSLHSPSKLLEKGGDKH